jgi:hypothetical protein
MPPHGEGDPFLLNNAGHNAQGNGPTLQAVGSDDEQSKPQRPKTGRQRTKSIAYGTLETIMSSSKSSEEDKAAKKSAQEIVDEVRGRAAKKASKTNTINGNMSEEHFVSDLTDIEIKPQQASPKSRALATLIIGSVYSFKGDSASHPVSTTALISGPAHPQTCVSDDILSSSDNPIPSTIPSMSSKLALIRQDSRTSTLIPKPDEQSSVVSSISSWLSWSKPKETLSENGAKRLSRVSNAEGRLRELLKSTEGDRKGKAADRVT